MPFRFGLLVLLAVAPLASAEMPIKIESVRIGLPPGRFAGDSTGGQSTYVTKTNAWAPVYVTFEIVREITKEAAIVIQTTDTDDLNTYSAVPLQNLSGEKPGTRIQAAELRFLPYVRPTASNRNEVKVSICVPARGVPPERWEPLSLTKVSSDIGGLNDPSRYVILSLGSVMPGLTLPKEAEGESSTRSLRNGRIKTGAITEVAEMPDQWFGYEAVDLAVLCTGTSDKFLTALFTDPANRSRLDALLEWVRRGGKLVVSLGRNTALLSQAQFEPLQAILPAKIKADDPIAQVAKLAITWGLARTNDPLGVPLSGKENAPFPMANLAPRADRPVRTLVPPDGRLTGEDRPTVMQSAYGLGRITVVAFDLDRSPFVDYSQRGRFWDNLINEAGSARAANGTGTQKNSGYGYNYGSPNEAEDELASTLRSHIDYFEGVPVISFGWVAVFILLYTLLIGPVEYFILKKVFKRLELTWLTFPIIVISVSAIAYFTAYAIKGKDLKINKLDLVDIDPASERIYGRMWVTLFSPRIDSYRIGIDPNAGWTALKNDSPTAGSMVDWFGGIRSGSQSLLRKSYWYRIDPPGNVTRSPYDDGLMDVPIPVWSTKAFSSDWSATLDSEKPLVASNLSHPPSDAAKVSGTFTLNLPCGSLTNAVIIYAGKGYPQTNPIQSGTAFNVFLDKPDPNWLSTFAANSTLTVAAQDAQPVRGRVTYSTSTVSSTGVASIAEMLFHDDINGRNDTSAPRNSTLRRLDQTWRLSSRNLDEIIVLAKLPSVRGPAEEVLTGTNSISPTRLWLRELPGEGKPRTPIPGNLKQDTYVRIFIPIKR